MSSLSEDPEVEAAKRGLDVVYPAENQLFIDMDNESDRAHMLAMIDVANRIGDYSDEVTPLEG